MWETLAIIPAMIMASFPVFLFIVSLMLLIRVWNFFGHKPGIHDRLGDIYVGMKEEHIKLRKELNTMQKQLEEIRQHLSAPSNQNEN